MDLPKQSIGWQLILIFNALFWQNIRTTHMTLRCWSLVTCAVLLTPAAFAQEAGTISVAISDNLIVINAQQRSGQIDLVNGSDDPMEFTVFPMSEDAGIVNSAAPILRWAPERSVAPAHRSQAFRVAARPTPELEPGEYAFQFGVRAQLQRDQQPVIVEEDSEEPAPLIAAIVPVVPVLPVTVYIRHKIDTPRVDIQPLVLTPDNPDSLGYFTAIKQHPGRSFVGTIQIVEKSTGTELSRGRLHLAQSGSEAKVNMPREFFLAEKGADYCLRIWDHFPAEGEPYASLCDS
jgi:hypothetical protein